MWTCVIVSILITAVILLWLRHEFVTAPIVDENENILEGVG